MAAELQLSDRIVVNGTIQNDYGEHFVDEMYNKDNNYYVDVQDDYELSSDRLKILKVPMIVCYSLYRFLLKDVQLGAGHFGKVYLGVVRCNITNRQIPVAVKMIKFENTNASKQR